MIVSRTWLITITTLAIAFAGTALNATAAVIQTFGSGSAVTTVEATADFESLTSLGSTYSEGGMTFNRVNYSLNNNSCGFAGCSGSFHPVGFIGNYFYGNTITSNQPSYIQILADGNAQFTGLEFITGFSPSNHNNVWAAYLSGALVSSGTGTHTAGSVLGFGSMSFDELRFASAPSTLSNFNQFSSAAIDNVRAQFGSNQIPAPTITSLIIIALAGFGFCRRQPKASNKYAAV